MTKQIAAILAAICYLVVVPLFIPLGLIASAIYDGIRFGFRCPDELFEWIRDNVSTRKPR